jgi:lambda family phage portal protein
MNFAAKMFYKIGDVFALGYDASESMRQRKDLGWGRSQARDEDSLVSADLTRQLIRQRAMDLRRNNPTVAGVCDRLPTWIISDTGILPQPRTSDSGWNKAAAQWWNEVYMPSCDSRGRSTMTGFQRLAISLRPTHGGLYFQKLDDGTVRPIECERIRNPTDAKEAKGYIDGVKVDPITGKTLAYRVHSRDMYGAFTLTHKEVDVPAEEIIPATTPAWRADMVREVADLAPMIPAFQDIHEMTSYTLNTAKVQSMYIAFLKKAGGMGLQSFARNTASPSATQRQTFKNDWGEILEGFPGDELEFKNSLIPNAQHVPFVKMHLALCAAGLGFPYEFLTLDLAGLDFSRQKGMLLLVNHAIRPWKGHLIRQTLQPWWNWRIAMEMGPGGALSPAPVDEQGISEWAKIDWHTPEELWIDRQESMQADILEVQAGQSTWTAAARRRGGDLERNLRQKAEDITLARKIAEEYELEEKDLLTAQIPGQTAINAPASGPKKPDDDKPKEEPNEPAK